MRKELIKKIVLSTMIAASFVLSGTLSNVTKAYAEGYVTTDNLNIRDDMDLSLDAFSYIPEGTEVKILSVSGDGAWAKVEYNGTTGYVLTMYLKEGTGTNTEKKVVLKEGVPTIVLDAGHGGDDPGAVAYHNGEEMEEADYALKIAKYLQDYLEEYGYNVIMTRDGDISITMKERVALANSNNANLYFSMHHNAAPSAVNGGLMIYPSQKKDNDAEDLSSSKALAELLAKGYEGTGMDNDGARRDIDISGFPLYVLSNTDMTSILAEMGFITNDGDASLIADPTFQKALAKNFAEQIHAYYSNN